MIKRTLANLLRLLPWCGILDTSNRIGVNPDVNFVCKLDKELYKVVTEDIRTDEVIITDERIQHIQERHRHRYEFNNQYKAEYEAAGMKCVGINPESDLVEIVEIPKLKWFVGTQFHPEYSSTVLNPHPLFVAFIKASVESFEEKEKAKK